MKRIAAVFAMLLLAAVPVLAVPAQASAGSSTDAALALGAFAVFNQIVRGQTIFSGFYSAPPQTVVVERPPVVYAPPPPVVYTPPPPVVYAPPPPPVVVYPYYYYSRYGYVTPGYYPGYRRW